MNRYLFLFSIFLNSQGFAHEIRPAFLQILQSDSSGSYEASFRQPQIAGRFLGLTLSTNCQQESISSVVNTSALTETFALNCGSQPLNEIEIVGLDRTMIDTLVRIINFNEEGENDSTILITGDEPRISLSSEHFGLPVYLSIGFEHLLNGYDHILFVLMLLYLIHRPSDIIKIVTIFTIAHSITLALSVFDIIKISQAPVEAVIAGSIILLAYENLRSTKSIKLQYLGFVTLTFGLLHGLGFAGALTEIGLPQSSQLSALFLFNLGLELGQLTIIVVFLIVAMAIRIKRNRLLFYAPIYLSGGIASYWFFDRSWQIMSPLIY